PAVATGRPLTVDIPAGGAVPVVWNLTAPGTEGNLAWTVEARTADGKATDQVSVTQVIAPAVPVETWAATLGQVGNTSFTITPPSGAIAGRGSVDVLLADTLAAPLQGVRDHLAAYPYDSLEPRVSRAIVMGDTGAWARVASELPAYL